MAVTLTLDMDKISPAKAQLAAGFILSYVKGCFTDEPSPEPVETKLDPQAAFGAPVPVSPGPVSNQGPVLVIPNPPPPPPAPAPVAVPTAPPSGGVTLDKEGLPWDGRIHSSGKAFNADGTWRAKRGVDAITISQVEAELKRLMSIPGPQSVPASPAPVIPPPPPPPAPAANEPDNMQKFVDLVGRTSAAMSAHKLSEDQLAKCCQAVGLEKLPQLGMRLDLLPQLANLIDSIIAGQSA